MSISCLNTIWDVNALQFAITLPLILSCIYALDNIDDMKGMQARNYSYYNEYSNNIYHIFPI